MVAFTGTVNVAPEPINVPPQLAVYHFHVAPVPNAPPTTLNVVVVGPQLAVILLAAPVGATELPFTVIVKLVDVPTQPAAVVGVTVIVAVTAVGVVLMAVKLGILPVPAAAKPMLGVLFVQLYIVPATVPVNVIAAVLAPVHNVWLATAPTLAVGFTVIVNVFGKPTQPSALGVTVMVATTGALVLFTATKAGILLPDPAAAKPMLGVLFVQVNVVPLTGPVKPTAVVVAPLHTVWLAGWFTIGVGFTVTVAIIGTPAHPPNDGVMVNVTITGNVAVVVNVPVIVLPVPAAAIPVAVATLSLVQL